MGEADVIIITGSGDIAGRVVGRSDNNSKIDITTNASMNAGVTATQFDIVDITVVTGSGGINTGAIASDSGNVAISASSKDGSVSIATGEGTITGLGT